MGDESGEIELPIYGSFNIVTFGDEKSSINDYMKNLCEKNFPDDPDFNRNPYEQIYTPLGRYGINLSMVNVATISPEDKIKYVQEANEIWYFCSITQSETLTSIRNDYIPFVNNIKKNIPSFLFAIGSEQYEGVTENAFTSKYGRRIIAKAKIDEFVQDFDLFYQPVSFLSGEGTDSLRGRLNQIVLDDQQGLQIACVVSCGMESKQPVIPNDFIHSLHIAYNKPFVHVLPIACESDDSITSAINTFMFTRNTDHITPIIFLGIYENDIFGHFDKELNKATKNFAQVAQIKMKFPVDEQQIEDCIKLIQNIKNDSIQREADEIAERKARLAREEAERKRKEREAAEEEARKEAEQEKATKKKESKCCKI